MQQFDAHALTRALRISGAVLVVASASTFMLQHWGIGNDLGRYAMLVGQSLLLAAAAYFVGLTVREGRGARTFLALVLATMPVSFAVLGGLVYSQFHVEGLAPLPQYASWVAPSPASALMALGATLLVLVPLGTIAFVALARKGAKGLTLAFFVSNLLMVLPVRQPELMVGLAGVALLLLLQLDLARFSRVGQLGTLEAKLARTMPFVAPIIILGRVIHLYHPTQFFGGAVLMIGGAALWLILPRVNPGAGRELGAWLSGILACLGWMFCCHEFSQSVYSAAFMTLLVGLPCAGFILVSNSVSTESDDVLVEIAVAVALVTALVAPLTQFCAPAALVCLMLGIGAAVWGAAARSLLRIVAGSLVALVGLVAEVWLAVQAADLSRWGSLCLTGILLIVGASYVERKGTRFARLWAKPEEEQA